MTSLIKNQVLKHLTKFFKDLAPEQLQLSAFKGSCELSNLQLEEKVLMDLLSFPAWLGINKATCDQLSIKIPWTKIKSVPIQMNLNQVAVEVEVCDEFRNVNDVDDDMNLANIINSAQVPGKYGFVDRVIDGITVTVNNVLITFKSKLMTATFNLTRVLLESRCPSWKPGELSLTRIKDTTRGQILLFKIVEWQNMRLEAKCLTDPLQAPLRLITNHAQCRLTIKKQLDDCSVSAARIFVIFEDILWVLTFAQFVSAAAFVEYIFTLIKRSPMSKKNNLCENQGQSSGSNPSNNIPNSNISHQTSFTAHQAAPLMSPPPNTSEKPFILTGNMSSACLSEQKFLCYDLAETSFHFYVDQLDAHLYDDIEVSANSSSRDSGGALQTTLDHIQVDCYPYSRVTSDRKHWYKWFDPSPATRRQWMNSHFAEFDLMQIQRAEGTPGAELVPAAVNEQLLSLVVLVKVKDYCMNCVATKHSTRATGLNKFIHTDKDYHMPAEMPSIYFELNYFYYFDAINRMMIYEKVPEPLAFMHLSPTKLLFDSPTLVFLNSFHVNLSKAFVHLNDLFPDETTAPRIHCRIEILMPQVSLPAKSSSDQAIERSASALLLKSGKVILCNSIYDKNLLGKLMESIDKLRESPSQPINFNGSYQLNAKKEGSCGDWNEIWNASLISSMSTIDPHNQLWALQFEPVWMDFMNYDVDDVIGGQLEPIMEPINASAFIHLKLAPKITTPVDQEITPHLGPSEKVEKEASSNDVNTISILVSVTEGPIMANMDKVQFSFLQRLGMQVEKMLQQIREDASTLIQMDTTFEDSLEVNLTAYIKEVRARLILDKKVETKELPVDELLNSQKYSKTTNLGEKQLFDHLDISPTNQNHKLDQPGVPVNNKHIVNLVYSNDCSKQDSIVVAVQVDDLAEHTDVLDECVEVADDASCLLLDFTDDKSTLEQKKTTQVTNNEDKSDIKKEKSRSDDLLVNLDEMEQSASLFAKVNLSRPGSSMDDIEQPNYKEQPQLLSSTQVDQQDSVTETVSYLELSMSQLMVRRITETRRRQKF